MNNYVRRTAAARSFPDDFTIVRAEDGTPIYIESDVTVRGVTYPARTAITTIPWSADRHLGNRHAIDRTYAREKAIWDLDRPS